MSTTLLFDIVGRDRASDKFDKVGRSAGGATDKLKKFAKVGALAVGAAAVVAGKALIDMTKSAMEDEKAQGVLAQSMKNAAGANKSQVRQVEAWISAQGKAKGIADDELRPAMSRLVQATGDVHKSQKLASLAMDVSAGTGKSLKSVTDALAKAQNGSTAGLSKMGIAVKNADDSMKPLAQITRELADLHGGQSARAAETTEGKMKRLKVMYDETKESIGAKLIPVADKMATLFMDKVVPAAGKVGDWIQQKLLPPIKDFAEKAAPKARDIMDALKGAFQDSKPFLELVGKIITNVVVPGLKKLLDVAGPALVGAIKGIGKGLEAVGKAGTWMWNNALQPAFKFIAKGIGTILDGWSSMLGAMGKVPSFGWAKDASVAMGKAADKAYAIADGLKKIPPKKTVTVTVVYAYQGKRNAGKEEQLDYLGRTNTAKTAGEKFMELLADGMKAGGKKVDKVLEASRDRIKSALAQVRSDMASLSASIASALNPDAFSFSDILQVIDEKTGEITTKGQTALQQSMAQLSGTNSALINLQTAFATLKGGASKGFLSSLMQSGNISLMQQYAADPGALAEGSRLFDENAAWAKKYGDEASQAILGDKIEKALATEMGKVRDELKDLSGQTAKKLRKEIADLRLEVVGPDAGRRAYLRTG